MINVKRVIKRFVSYLYFLYLCPQKNEVMRRIFFYTTLLFVLMVQYPQVSFAEKRNLIFTANNVDPAQNPRDKYQRTIMMMPSVAIDEYELFFSDSHPSYIIRLENEDGDVVFEQSIPEEEYGDYVLDYYGIRDWVESLPKRSTSMMILQNYTIIGL